MHIHLILLIALIKSKDLYYLFNKTRGKYLTRVKHTHSFIYTDEPFSHFKYRRNKIIGLSSKHNVVKNTNSGKKATIKFCKDKDTFVVRDSHSQCLREKTFTDRKCDRFMFHTKEEEDDSNILSAKSIHKKYKKVLSAFTKKICGKNFNP